MCTRSKQLNEWFKSNKTGVGIRKYTMNMLECKSSVIHALLDFLYLGDVNITVDLIHHLAHLFTIYDLKDGVAAVNMYWMRMYHLGLCSNTLSSNMQTYSGMTGPIPNVMSLMHRDVEFRVMIKSADKMTKAFHNILVMAFCPCFFHLHARLFRDDSVVSLDAEMGQDMLSSLHSFLYSFANEGDSDRKIYTINVLQNKGLLIVPV